MEERLPIGLGFSALKGAHDWLADAMNGSDIRIIFQARIQLETAVQRFLEALQLPQGSIPYKVYGELGRALVKESQTMIETASFRLSSELRSV